MLRSANTAFLSALLVIFLVTLGSAQVVTGVPPFASTGGGPFDSINLGNLNVHFPIPIIHKAGRGIPFDYDLSYDNSIWYPVSNSGVLTWSNVKTSSVTNYGWTGLTPAGMSYVGYFWTSVTNPCGPMGQNHFTQWTFSNFVYFDNVGTPHY